MYSLMFSLLQVSFQGFLQCSIFLTSEYELYCLVLLKQLHKLLFEAGESRVKVKGFLKKKKEIALTHNRAL